MIGWKLTSYSLGSNRLECNWVKSTTKKDRGEG